MKPKILVIEDNADCRELLEFYLRQMGYESSGAPNGAKGFALARNESPNLIILDLGLPDISGIDVLDLLKHDASTAAIPVIILTAWSQDSIRAMVIQGGATDFLTKPISSLVLKSTIEKVLGTGSLPKCTGPGQ